MGHARYIGRVGALAVALGIGSAIASPGGIAWAEPDSGPSASADASAGGQASGGAGSDTSESAGSNAQSGSGDSDTESAADDAAEPDDAVTDDDTVADGVDSAGDATDDSAADIEGAEEQPDVEDTDVAQDDSGPAAVEESTDTAGDTAVEQAPTRTSARHRLSETTAPVAKHESIESSAPATVEAATDDQSTPSDPPAPLSRVAPLPRASVTASEAGDSAPLPSSTAVESGAMTTTLLSALLLPGAPGVPAAPADTPLVWGLLAFARRQSGQQARQIGSAGTQVTSGELLDAAAEDNNPPTGRAVVGSPSWFSGKVTGRVIGSDPDRDRLTYSGSTDTGKGTVVVAANGRFTYTPTAEARHAAAQTGASEHDLTDTFTVAVDDGNGGVTPVSVTVRISPFNQRPTSSASVDRPDMGTGVVTGTIETADPDGDSVTYVASDPGKGFVEINDDGTFAYTPTEAAREAASARPGRAADRTDRFTVTVDDGHGGFQTVAVTVAIAAIDNSAPEPVQVDTSTPNPFSGSVRGRLIATDPDGDRLTFSGTTSTAKGTVTVAPSGRFIYTPTAAARHAAAADGASDEDKTDVFDITVVDAYGGTAVVPVVVNVAPLNSAPTRARASAGAPDADTGAVAITVTARDADNDALSVSAPDTDKGGVVDNGDGTFTYTPTVAARLAAGADGASNDDMLDTVTFTVDDGHGGTATASVTVAIVPLAAVVNHDPTDGAYEAGEPDSDAKVTGQVTATDPDGDDLTYSGPDTSTKGGAVTVNADGTFDYTPSDDARHAASALGASTADQQDTFTVTVSDGQGGTLAVPVTVAILPKNTAPDGSYTAGQPDSNGKISGAVTSTDADGDTRTYSAPGTSAKGGTVHVNADGTFTYTPSAAARENAAKAGATTADKTDSFVVTVDDGHVGGATTVTVSVAILPAPNSAPTNGKATVGQPGTDGKVSGTVTATDANGDPLSYSGPVTSARGGTVLVNANGTFLYSPSDDARHAASALGATTADKQDTFTVTVSDGRGGTLEVPVTVAVLPKNAAPTGSYAAGAPDSNGVVTGTVTSADADGDTRTYSGPATSAKGGTVTLNPTTGAFTYTPTAAAREQATQSPGVDTDTFTVTVSDGHGGSTPVEVTVTIAPNVVTSDSVSGVPFSGVIAAPGGTLYEITTDASSLAGSGSTYVSVLTADGRVLTTAEVPGQPAHLVTEARPDGTLLVTTTDVQAQKTYFTAVGSAGQATTVKTVDGASYYFPATASNGTIFTLITLQDEQNAFHFSLVRIAPDNTVTTYALNTSATGPVGAYSPPVVGPDGAAYVLSADAATQQASIFVVRPDGSSFSTSPISVLQATPIVVGADGTAYAAALTINEAAQQYETTIVTIKGSDVTTRSVVGLPASQLIAAPDGSVLLTVTDVTSEQYSLVRITPTGITSSATASGLVESWPQVAADGTAYLTGSGDAAQVTVLRPDGSSLIVELPGDPIQGQVSQFGITGIGPDNKAYIPVSLGDGFGVAVVGASGLETTYPIDGFPTQAPVFDANGHAIQTVDTGLGSTQLVVLSTGATSTALAGSAAQSQGIVPSVVVGPEGTAFLLTTYADGTVHGLAFNPDGTTVGTFTDHGTVALVLKLGGLQGYSGSQFVFGPDGTAYVTVDDVDNTSSTAAYTKATVYAMNATGVTKVAEVADAYGLAVTVAPDGTVYLSTTTGDLTGGFTTTVRAISTTDAL
ncbi:Ig-like domain-containing protein [Mycolicibacterium chubuense]|nr:Ig-like domain-containing protein [Mycolicibacterium chubuense]